MNYVSCIGNSGSISFDNDPIELSHDILLYYKELKSRYKYLYRAFSDPPRGRKQTIAAIKSFLDFYMQSEIFINTLFREILRPSFYRTLSRRRPFFVILNKVLKIFVSLDILVFKSPELYVNFTKFKRDTENVILEQRLSVITGISLPMGRMVVSLFTNDGKELYVPPFLSKHKKIDLSLINKNLIPLYFHVLEDSSFKYVSEFLRLIDRKFAKKSLCKMNASPKLHSFYFTLLEQHQ